MLKIKITNYLLKNGKKNLSEKILINIFKKLNSNYKKKSKLFFKFSIISIAPILYIKSKKKKFNLSEIPYILKPINRIFYSLKFIKKKTLSQSFLLSFFNEITNNMSQKSFNYQKKKNLYIKAFLKKSIIHYRWF